jgi:hypothetical protein
VNLRKASFPPTPAVTTFRLVVTITPERGSIPDEDSPIVSNATDSESDRGFAMAVRRRYGSR